MRGDSPGREEMDHSVEPQEETDNLKSPISINKIKVVVINFPSR